MSAQSSVLLAGLSVLMIVTACAAPPNQVSAPNSQPTPAVPDAFEINRRLGRGINLANALEAPREGEWGVRLEAEYFKIVRDAGFKHVRIPIRWSAHAQREAPYTINPDFFARIDWAVEQALSNGLLAIINVHHYEEIFVNPEAERERFLSLWDQIATRYQDRPPELLFELLNEPQQNLTAPLWNELVKDTLAVVRRTNPTRVVVVGGVDLNSINGLESLELPDDPYLIATFHYYTPFPFTHQGAEWVSDSNAWLGTRWRGGSADQLSISLDLEKAAEWGLKHNRPIYAGEFGAYSKADMESRQKWTSYVARECERLGFSWAYWEFGAGFGAYNLQEGKWVEPLITALIPPS